MDKKTKIISLDQKPIITFDLVEQKGKEIQEQIESLDLDNLDSSEDNLKNLKSIRTDLNRQFTEFEDQRKMVKELVMKPYNDFDTAYKSHISEQFKNADSLLKSKVDDVDKGILDAKIEGIKKHFDDANIYDFLSFEKLGLKIIKSKSDKSIHDEIEAYLQAVDQAIETIESLDNKDRVLAKYQVSLDLAQAISETNQEIKREEEIEQQRLKKEQSSGASTQPAKQVQQEVKAETPVQSNTDDEKVFSTSFRVFGTKKQLADLKNFILENGMRYE